MPDEDCWLRAGVIVGTLIRTQNFGKSERKELYADALICLCASKRGLPVLTRNVRDFALIVTVHDAGRFIRSEFDLHSTNVQVIVRTADSTTRCLTASGKRFQIFPRPRGRYRLDVGDS